MIATLNLDTILAKYSTPGLRRHELTRSEKFSQLAAMKVDRETIEKILTNLYPAEEPIS